MWPLKYQLCHETEIGNQKAHRALRTRPAIDQEDREKTMIYRVYWLEKSASESLLFNSLAQAKYFALRLQRNPDCKKVVLEQTETLVA